MSTQSLVNTPTKISPVQFQWILASGLGWVIGNWVASHAIIYLINFFAIDTFNGPSVNTTVISFLEGILVGTIIGVLQSLILPKRFSPTRFWILSNSIGWAFAYMAGSWATWKAYQSSPTALDIDMVGWATNLTVMGICAGFGLAILQWFVAKGNIANPIKWLALSFMAWSVPLIIFAIFIYLTIVIPMNDGFVLPVNVWQRWLLNIRNTSQFILHYGIGFMAGVITSRTVVENS